MEIRLFPFSLLQLMENLLFSKVKGTAKQNKTKPAFLCAPFTSYKLQGKNITINTFPYRHRLAWQTGWLKHMPLTSADSNLRNSSNLTASCNVKLGCLGWMRADFFFQISLSCYCFVFFEMATNGLIVYFSRLVTCCLLSRQQACPLSVSWKFTAQPQLFYNERKQL